MQHVLIGVYVLFFATGFMGLTALTLLKVRLRSQVMGALIVFQSLFLAGVGIIVFYFYVAALVGGVSGTAAAILRMLLALLNSAVWVTGAVLVHRIAPVQKRPRRFQPRSMEILAALVILWTLTNAVFIVLFGHDAAGGTAQVANDIFGFAQSWALAGHVLVGLALFKFGLTARGPINPAEPDAVRAVIRTYGLWALIFAPVGLIEFAIESARLPWLPTLPLDFLLYLSLNIVSMSAALRLFTPGVAGTPMLDGVTAEQRRMLNLSEREAEIAVLIARGLANKQIAAELGISPATVRTHIYNLYQKVGVRSRVELLNKLRG